MEDENDAVLHSVGQHYIFMDTGIENGTIQVYKEYKPRTNVVEYTVYFRHGGRNHRVDFEIHHGDFMGIGLNEAGVDDVELFLIKYEIRRYLKDTEE